MVKNLKKLIPIMSIIGALVFTSTSVNAFNKDTTSIVKNEQVQTEDNGLRPLGYTMDEINQMSLEEYYRFCFPEVWETFSNEEIEQYKTINYEEFHSETKPSVRKPIIDVFVSYAAGSSPATKSFTGRIGITGDGSKKAYSMDTTYVLYDTTGATYGGGSGGNKNCTYYESSLTSRVIPSGRRAYIQGTCRLKMTSSSATQTTSEKSNIVTVK